MRTFDSRTITSASEIRIRFVVVKPVITSGPLRAIELIVPLHSWTFDPETTTLPADMLQTSIQSLRFPAARIHLSQRGPDSKNHCYNYAAIGRPFHALRNDDINELSNRRRYQKAPFNSQLGRGSLP
jgi:hypothetical protein